MKKSIAMGALSLMVATLQLLATANAFAQEKLIAQLDQDEDGLISIREAVADPNLLAVFGKIDTNGDGKISAEELSSSTLAQALVKN